MKILQSLLMMIKIFSFTVNSMNSIWKMLVIMTVTWFMKSVNLLSASKRHLSAYNSLGIVQVSRNAIQPRLWWQSCFYLNSAVFDKHSTCTQRYQVLGMLATSALIFHSIHTQSPQSFPLTKYKQEPESRGFGMMKPMGISFWMVPDWAEKMACDLGDVSRDSLV